MPREFKRADRIADAVQRSLARLIPAEIDDPRLGMVNINSVDVTRDLAHAKVFVTFVGQDDRERCAESVDILNNASSYLRTLMGKDLTMRSTPRLKFVFDEATVRGQALSALIEKAVASDQSRKDQDEE